jgi:hypothetical protein
MRFYDQLINESLAGAAQAAPATTTVRSAKHPRVYVDGRVIFKVHLPHAASVQLEGGQGLCPKPVPISPDYGLCRLRIWLPDADILRNPQ